ncbi:MAG: GNAT family N-acetyltransferase [Parvibaculaceae bacterium]
MAGGEGRSTVETVVTFLEMSAPPSLFVPTPANMRLALMRTERMPVHFYRYLYDTVGRDHVWLDRKRLSDEALVAELSAPGVEIFVLYAGGVPAGFFELDRADEPVTWLRYFGIVPDFHGRGLGKWLLKEALAEAWRTNPSSVRVETCTLDSPRALPLYQRLGFVPYERQNKTMVLD